MTQRPFLVALLGALLLGVPAPRSSSAANEGWREIEKAFKKEFKPGKTGRGKREALLKSVRRSKDGRAVKLLLSAQRDQIKYADKLLDTWTKGMEEWQEKTSRLERQREERVRKIVEKARAEGKEPKVNVDLGSEEGRWLGAPPKHPGEMVKARQRLMKQHDEIRAERDLGAAILRGVVKVLREVEGEEFTGGVRELLQAVRKVKGMDRAGLISTLGYVRGDEVTREIIGYTKESDPALVQAALAALGRQNTDEGKGILLEFLGHEDWQLRSAALDGLIFYRDVAVMDALLARAEKEGGVIRRRIFQTMSAIVGEQVKAVLEAWLSWWPANKTDVVARWKRIPREAPVVDDPPRLPVETESSAGGTSFYGIKTDSKHIIFVADISGSMRRTDEDPADQPAKIDVCRDELKRAIRSLSATDEDERGAATFNVVLFSTDILVYKPGKMVVATKRNKEKVFKWIDKHVQADMQTNIWDAIDQAFHIVSDSSDRKNRDRGADTIFLMTDGAPSRGKFVRPEVILEEVRRINKVRDITIHTIGVGKGHNKGFLQRLATENGGQYLSRD
jgi:hypothetical protein